MSKSVKRIAVTGGAGQIAYSILFRIAGGDLLGKDQPIALQILELPHSMEGLKGVVMELEDCAFPLLKEIKIGTNPKEMFEGVDYALLIGAKPRGPGMERKDLLADNAKIFIEQGKALNDVANPNVLVLVVGNPCNTNCLIAQHHAPKIPSSQFFAMMQLDQNRATSLLAKKAGVDVSDISHMTIWGNHSSTLVPDFENVRIKGKPALEVIKDRNWFEKDFIEQIQKRGAAIIAARGKSSAASAANAAIESMRALIFPTPQGQWFSCAHLAKGNPYGIREDLVFSFPCVSKGDGKVEIVRDVPLDDFLKNKLKLSEKELIEEQEIISKLL